MKFILLPIFLFISVLSFAQQKQTINGYVKDSLSGETLRGATISAVGKNSTIQTNNYGYFSLTLPENSFNIQVSFIGYETKSIHIDSFSAHTFTIYLSPVSYNLQQVIISAKKRESNVQTAQMGKVDLSIAEIKAIPSFLGETDILKALQLLPGVRNAGEGNSGFYVRGGGPDQNLVLLDDAVVYNTGHLFGFFSVFNADAVKSVTLIKGGFPAQYGGRLSSVIDIVMKDGNINKTEVDAGIGLIASRLSIQGPLVKNKASYMLSARRTYIDALTKPFLGKTNNYYGSGYYFYDLNAKANYQFSNNDRLFLSGYFGRDQFDFNNVKRSFTTNIPWGNSTATLRWNHVFNKKLFANTSLIYNDYKFDFNGAQNNFNINVSSGIKDLNVKTDFDFYPVPEHKLKMGAQYTYHTFLPSLVSGNQDTTVFQPLNVQKKYAGEFAVYIQDDWAISKGLKVNYGLRYSSFTQLGPYTAFTSDANGNHTDSTLYSTNQPIKTYGGFEPRITWRVDIDSFSSIKVAVSRNLQYIHLVSNAGTTLPTDIWVPSTYRVKPQIAWQYALGYFRNFANNTFETSLELYYKSMDNQIEYREGYTPNTLKDPEEDFVFGKGWSYGSELFIHKVKGRFTGWIGYTLSWTWRKFPSLNSGDKFPGKYDRRHDLSVVGTYQLNPKWTLSSVFVFGTGNAISLPERFYFIDGVLTQEFSRVNAYRMAPYHRLDISATYTPVQKKTRWYKGSWVFSVYNVYSRLNPYFLYFDQEGSAANGTLSVTTKQVSLFPVIPSVTWNVHF
ncbi:MAG: TonB-dependent receptor [Chitinophagaceae bacterium]